MMRGHFGFRSPIKAALLYPFEAAMVFWMLVAAIVFTFWPEALEHAPVSFEERGFIHHVWHYSLLAGAVVSSFGLLMRSPKRTLVEVLGLVLITCTVALNLIAVVSAGLTDNLPGSLDGWDVALRLGLLTGLALRIYILIREPIVEVTVQTVRRDDQ